jgi:LacI family transcriptional regulator
MRDIAQAVGVHPTTVSMALRAHPSIPPATCAKIRAAAKRLGYTRDPMLDAFNTHRVRQRNAQPSHCVAFIVDTNSSALFDGATYHPRVYQGVRAAAETNHYTVETFPAGGRELTASRLNSIITSRGITGVLLSTFNVTTLELGLDWDKFCAVKIESHHLLPRLDVVSADQFQAARLCIRKLRELGYRRIGMAMARDDDARLNELYSTGVLVEQAELPESECVPPLLFTRAAVPYVAAAVAKWIDEYKVDVVISNWNELLQFADHDPRTMGLANTGVRIPHDVAWASLDVPEGRPQLAGVVQNHRLVGMRAMEQLAMLMKTFHHGPPPTPSATYVPGFWQDGPSAPPRPRTHY